MKVTFMSNDASLIMIVLNDHFVLTLSFIGRGILTMTIRNCNATPNLRYNFPLEYVRSEHYVYICITFYH